MKPPDARNALRQMLDHALEAVQMCQGHDYASFQRNRMLQLAVTRLVEVVGEAAGRVDDSTCSDYPGIPWQEARRTRNRLIHGYDSIDLQILWATVTHDFPPLIQQLQRILKDA